MKVTTGVFSIGNKIFHGGLLVKNVITDLFAASLKVTRENNVYLAPHFYIELPESFHIVPVVYGIFEQIRFPLNKGRSNIFPQYLSRN